MKETYLNKLPTCIPSCGGGRRISLLGKKEKTATPPLILLFISAVLLLPLLAKSITAVHSQPCFPIPVHLHLFTIIKKQITMRKKGRIEKRKEKERKRILRYRATAEMNSALHWEWHLLAQERQTDVLHVLHTSIYFKDINSNNNKQKWSIFEITIENWNWKIYLVVFMIASNVRSAHTVVDAFGVRYHWPWEYHS